MNVLVVGDEALKKNLSGLLSRLKVHFKSASDLLKIKGFISSGSIDVAILDYDFLSEALKASSSALLKKSKTPFIVISSEKDPSVALLAKKHGASDFIIRPYHQREFIMRFNASAHKKKRICCIGGGTGLFTLLLGLKMLPNTLLISVVNMSDDGGSSGKLSQTFGILPPGDIRRSLVALSNAPEVMNEIMQHRFDKKGDLHGHSFGNIFLTVLAEVKGSMSEAVRALSDILNIQGIVLPSTRSLAKLVAKFENGLVVKGESKIDLCEGRKAALKIEKIWHEPDVECDADAYASIINADAVTIGPGDLFTSVITNLVVQNAREAIKNSKAKKIYICNLMTKPGETSGFGLYEHVKEIIKYIGGDYLDYILISNTKVSDESIREYAKKNQQPVVIGNKEKIKSLTKAKIILADIGHETELVRHDSEKLRNEISKIIQKIG
jgi:uncharacterized cofD-like protein